VLLISLSLSGYSYLVSSSASTLPNFVYEGMDEMDPNMDPNMDEDKKKKETEENNQ
jgi:hypothetical protein